MTSSFTPHTLPIQNLDCTRLLTLVGKANSILSNYNGFLSHVKTLSLLLNIVTTQEAVSSSRIEVVQISLSEVLEHEAVNLKDKRKVTDVEEVNNYKKALEYGVKELEKRPLCLDLIKEIHNILLQGVCGENKVKGEFRKVQNYVYSYGAISSQTRFTPPSPEKMPPALDEWGKYIYNEEEETLIQLAVIHAQFALIHPFADGNDRVGRVLIPLFLYARKYLHYPIFYLSEYFESHRCEYHDRLLNIATKDDWQGWIEFFLHAIINQSEISQFRATRIVELYEKTKTAIINNNIADFLFKKSILTAPDFVKEGLVANSVSANRMVLRLCDIGVLQKIHEGSGTRPTVYGFSGLLKLVESK